jgi:hypothetical protein
MIMYAVTTKEGDLIDEDYSYTERGHVTRRFGPAFIFFWKKETAQEFVDFYVNEHNVDPMPIKEVEVIVK